MPIIKNTVTRKQGLFQQAPLGGLPGDAEKAEVVANCDHLQKLKCSPTRPYAFTEHGAIMLANVLNSERAVEASIHVVRAFVRMRLMLADFAELKRKIERMERKYDVRFKAVFQTIRKLMEPPSPKKKRRRIGFVSRDDK